MKRSLLIAFLLIAFCAQAQETSRSSTRKIDPVPETEEGGSLLFPKKKESTPIYKRPSTKPMVNMRTERELLDPGVQFTQQKFFKDEGNSIGFKSDTFLGEIRTGEAVLEMVCRDHKAQDGDRVRVWIDDKMVVKEIYLTNAFQGFKINLKPGFNKIEIEALNQGLSGPNTAEFKVMNEKGEVLSKNVWNLASGVRATMIVIKS
ncbi:hypothetical protein [Nonlabens ponticola]|uniref:Secreted protein n=1 Tax=Nonlabens ponticola TaxID=2496866 RepID=A0A3S9MYM6_9FLAO|nr:hypothetical protein [Nonlabens ponticola]AZQ44224.1 hypothetical protein EJ995_08240 [Nonlabens ponticola]